MGAIEQSQKPVDPVKAIYDELGRRLYQRWEQRDGKEVQLVGSGYGDCEFLYAIECFVASLSRTRRAPFYKGELTNSARLARLAPPFGLMREAERLHVSEYLYSPNVSLFFDVCRPLGILHPGTHLTGPHELIVGSHVPTEGVAGEPLRFQGDLFDEMVRRLMVGLASSDFKKKAKRREEAARGNFESAVTHMDACFQVCPVLNVQCLDLSYRVRLSRSVEEPMVVNTLERLKADREALARALTKERRAAGIIGHLIKLEYGPDKGYQLHVLLLCDGRQSAPIPPGKEWLEKQWCQIITRGEGLCHDIAGNSKPSELSGLGLIHGSDKQKRLALCQGRIRYLAKSALYLRVAMPEGEKAFFKGDPPKVEGESSEGGLGRKTQKDPRPKAKAQSLKKEMAELEVIYRGMEQSWNEFDALVNGDRPDPLRPQGFSRVSLFLDIERLLQALEHDASNPYHRHDYLKNGSHYGQNPLGVLLSGIVTNIGIQLLDVRVWNPDDVLGPRVAEFLHLYREVKQRHPRLDQLLDMSGRPTQLGYSALNAFVMHLRERLKVLKRVSNKAKSDGKERLNGAEDYVDSLFKRHPILYVFSLQLGLDRETQIKCEEDPSRLKELLAKGVATFFSKGRERAPLSWGVGHVGKWEYCPEKGGYVHVVFFVEHNKVSDEKSLPDAVGQQWQRHMNGAGVYHRCRSSWHTEAPHDWISRIERNDKAVITALKKNVLTYMAQSRFYYRSRVLPMKELFFRGDTLA